MTARDPSDFAGAIALADINAECVFETLPLGYQQGSGARCHETEAGRGVVPAGCFAVYQHVQGRRVARGDGRLVIVRPVEKPGDRELAGEQQGCTLGERAQRGQDLRRHPVHRAEIQYPVFRRHPESVGDR